MQVREIVLEYDLDHYGDPKGAVWEGGREWFRQVLGEDIYKS